MSADMFMEFLKWILPVALGGVATWGIAKRVATTQSVQDASADAEIAGAKLGGAIQQGQYAELLRLQKLVGEMSEALAKLNKRVARLEADINILDSYFDGIVLCDTCMAMHGKIIDRIKQVFRQMDGRDEDDQQKQPPAKPAPDVPDVPQVAAAFAGKENYERGANPQGNPS